MSGRYPNAWRSERLRRYRMRRLRRRIILGCIVIALTISAGVFTTHWIRTSSVDEPEVVTPSATVEPIQESKVSEEPTEESILPEATIWSVPEPTFSPNRIKVKKAVPTITPIPTLVPIEEPKAGEVEEPVAAGKKMTVTATAYCPCSKCCGQWSNGITATGVTAKAGRTIAVDPRVIPYGSRVTINGHTYIAEDCGGAVKGNKIDIFFDTHSEALDFGKQTLTVYIEAA